MKKTGFFWVSYSDLMTSLFFIMLVLYVVTFSVLQVEFQSANEKAVKLEKIEEIQEALETLDKKYFEFDKDNKRYKLSIDAQFKKNSSEINDIILAKRQKLLKAGQELYNQLNRIIENNSNIDYLLVIEGNTSKYENNWIDDPDKGYRLSYNRALSLYNFWKDNGINFRALAPQCEIIIAGSGYFGQSRDKKDEQKNKRFTIQITSKVGKLIDENKELQ
jgi:outer membrane protein OmpA-like peptidoglycan-associated protein